jgi:poly-beta-1,6-N-acetyl-D-glucosamine synthase
MVTNNMTEDVYLFFGLLLLLFSISPPAIHYLICHLNYKKINNPNAFIEYPKINLFLPVKNESKVIVNKLEEILSMDYDKNLISLLIVDSGSKDDTSQIASEFLKSKYDTIKWKIHHLKQPGKSAAVNFALQNVQEEFLVMMDAEAILDNSALKLLISWFENPKIGAVCGHSSVKNTNASSKYRSRFNVMRIGESAIYGTPIFEGSICAFRMISIPERKIDPDINSDDSQLAQIVLKNGYRAIMDPNIKFHEPDFKGVNLKQRQLRRGQGLIRLLLKNKTMSFNKGYGLIFANVFYFHIIMPWLFIISLFLISFFGGSFLYLADFDSIILIQILIFSIVSLSLSKTFRNFIFGVNILIQAQILLFIGKKLNIWDTDIIARQKSNILREDIQQ